MIIFHLLCTQSALHLNILISYTIFQITHFSDFQTCRLHLCLALSFTHQTSPLNCTPVNHTFLFQSSPSGILDFHHFQLIRLVNLCFSFSHHHFQFSSQIPSFQKLSKIHFVANFFYAVDQHISVPILIAHFPNWDLEFCFCHSGYFSLSELLITYIET